MCEEKARVKTRNRLSFVTCNAETHSCLIRHIPFSLQLLAHSRHANKECTYSATQAVRRAATDNRGTRRAPHKRVHSSARLAPSVVSAGMRSARNETPKPVRLCRRGRPPLVGGGGTALVGSGGGGRRNGSSGGGGDAAAEASTVAAAATRDGEGWPRAMPMEMEIVSCQSPAR